MKEELTKIFAKIEGVDAKSLDFLLSALVKNNLSNFDYLEYKRSLNALKEMDMDEEMAYKSTFATGSVVGLTKDKLLKSAEFYKNVLKKEQNQFDDALKNQLEKRVNSKKKEAEQLKKDVVQWQNEITALEAKIKKAQKILSNVDNDILTETTKIDTAKNNFENTLSLIVAQIDDDINKIKTLI